MASVDRSLIKGDPPSFNDLDYPDGPKGTIAPYGLLAKYVRVHVQYVSVSVSINVSISLIVSLPVALFFVFYMSDMTITLSISGTSEVARNLKGPLT